jgi:acyl carrier protein
VEHGDAAGGGDRLDGVLACLFGHVPDGDGVAVLGEQEGGGAADAVAPPVTMATRGCSVSVMAGRQGSAGAGWIGRAGRAAIRGRAGARGLPGRGGTVGCRRHVDRDQSARDLVREIKELIIETLMLQDMTPEDIDEHAPLLVEGLGLDSIDVLELAMAINKRYGVKTKADDSQNRHIFASATTWRRSSPSSGPSPGEPLVRGPVFARFVVVVRTLLVIAYPAAIYLGVTRLEPRALGLVVLGLVIPNLALQLAQAPPEQRWAVLRIPGRSRCWSGSGRRWPSRGSSWRCRC